MKNVKTFLVLAVLAATVSACGSGDAKIITLIAGNDELRFCLSGSGTATIAWGNQKETAELSADELTWFTLAIPDINARTITLSGEITGFECTWGGITELDVSRNTALTDLDVSVNQLKSLDVSKNTALKSLHIKANEFTAAALNDLFATLHGKGGIINIAYNPGVDDCNISMAEAKGWEVLVVEPEYYD